MRTFLLLSFVCLIFAAIAVAVISFNEHQWEALTASFSLLIAIISAWVAYEGYHKQYLVNKPQIILSLDFSSRVDLIQLVAKNLGQRPAFNIKIHWNEQLINLKNEPVSFNKFSTDIDIPVLNPSESTSAFVDASHAFFKKHKETNLDYSGKITFQESLNSKKKTTQSFFLSFKHYAAGLTYDHEEPKTMVELQKIPDALKEISKQLTSINKALRSNDAEQ